MRLFPRTPVQAALCAALLIVIPAKALAAASPCARSAQATFLACQLSAGDDYWISVAICQNLPTAAQTNCINQARAARRDAMAGCADQNAARLDVCSELGGGAYHPAIDPANFTDHIDNPLLPFTPGTTYVYETHTPDGLERDVVEVTHDTEMIVGVTCVVVHDRVTLNGELTEDTLDWYAQDKQGNVWYFGEDSRQYESGDLVGIEGSWQAGRDGAQPGIVMEASPAVGDIYRQEFLPADAEDLARVVDLAASAAVPYGSFTGILKTNDFSPLEPDVVESKFYAPGVGTVLEIDENGVRTELVSIQTH